MVLLLREKWGASQLPVSLSAGVNFISSKQLPCNLLATQTTIWPVTVLTTCRSQRDSIYPAIITSLACTHRIIVDAGFRLLCPAWHVSANLVYNSKIQRMQTVATVTSIRYN